MPGISSSACPDNRSPALCSVKDKHGFVLGGLEGSKYSEYELHLEPGAKLFVYTDGVPEATNATNELFGTERMIHALNARLDADPMEVLENMRSAVDGFVLDAEQFDDMTMLCLEYKGNNSKKNGSTIVMRKKL
ncbi:MAG: serine/threonine-protein phosphatase [Lachnospiraceae bacterium]|nr:serine/threonine-protein phosphatase [Lachnospiraceae bacterium]